MREIVTRGMVWFALVLLIFSAGCTRKMMGVADETGALDGSVGQETMNMPAGEAQAPSGTVVTPFDSRKIYFEFDRHDLSPDGRQILTEIAAYLKEHGELRLDIEGHCDERGTSEYNLALGERRACAARDFLVTMGIDAARIGTISYGGKARRPGKTEEARTKKEDQFIFSLGNQIVLITGAQTFRSRKTTAGRTLRPAIQCTNIGDEKLI